MFRPDRTLVLLTDFGTADPYVAEVKGAVLSVVPDVRIVDGTHEVPPQDVRTGAFWLARLVPAFPVGTMFLAVVDPGVGTLRRPALLEVPGHCLVGPDNGILSWVAAAHPPAAWRLLDRPDLVRAPVSRTFHGRDLFGPVAAALASGRVAPGDCGPTLPDPVVIPFPPASVAPGCARGEVLAVDRFGNLIVGIPADTLGPFPEGMPVAVRIGAGRGHAAAWGPYGAGTTLSVHEDSSGWVEVAVRGASASRVLRATAGSKVTLRW